MWKMSSRAGIHQTTRIVIIYSIATHLASAFCKCISFCDDWTRFLSPSLLLWINLKKCKKNVLIWWWCRHANGHNFMLTQWQQQWLHGLLTCQMWKAADQVKSMGWVFFSKFNWQYCIVYFNLAMPFKTNYF